MKNICQERISFKNIWGSQWDLVKKMAQGSQEENFVLRMWLERGDGEKGKGGKEGEQNQVFDIQLFHITHLFSYVFMFESSLISSSWVL